MMALRALCQGRLEALFDSAPGLCVAYAQARGLMARPDLQAQGVGLIRSQAVARIAVRFRTPAEPWVQLGCRQGSPSGGPTGSADCGDPLSHLTWVF